MFGLLATGCGSTPTGTAQGPLQVRIWRSGQTVDAFKPVISAFELANPGKVTVTYTDHDLNGYELSALKSLAARQGPDIWSIPNTWLGDHVARIQSLPDNFFDDIAAGTSSSSSSATPPAIGAVTAVKQLYPTGIADQIISTDGKSVLGAPSSVDVLRLYYNPDVFSAATLDYLKSLGSGYSDSQYQPVRQLLASPPTTWSTLLNQEKYITKRNGKDITRGTIALGTADNTPESESILQLMMLQNGATIVTADRTRTRIQATDSTASGGTVRPGQNALDFYTSFSNPNNPNYTWNPSMPDALDAFGQGKLAMVIAYSDFGAKLKQSYPELDVQQAPVPQIGPAQTQAQVNFIRFDVEIVTQTADSYEAATKFLHRYIVPDQLNDIVNQGGLISPYLTKLNANQDVFPNAEVLTGQTVFEKDRANFDAAFHQMIVDVSQNGISTGDAIDAASDKLNGYLAEPDE